MLARNITLSMRNVGVAGSESNLVSWLDGGSKASLVTQLHNTAVAGELVGVDVKISNPMALGLSLTQLRAVYEHESGVTSPSNEYVKVQQTVCVLPVHQVCIHHRNGVQPLLNKGPFCVLVGSKSHRQTDNQPG